MEPPRRELTKCQGVSATLQRSPRLIQLGKVKDRDSWSPLYIEVDKLRCLAIIGPKWARDTAVIEVLLRLYVEGFKFTSIDTGRRLRSMIFSGIPIELHRVGVDSAFNPFATKKDWWPEEVHLYASLTSKAFASCTGLSNLHAHVLEAALSLLLEEEAAPSPLEVAQALEAQVDPASTRHRVIEDVKASLTTLQHGYASSSMSKSAARVAGLDPSRLSVVELSYLPTSELKAFYQACLLAKLLIDLRRGLLEDVVVAVEGFEPLSRHYPSCFEDLLAPLMDLGAILILASPRPCPEATLTMAAASGEDLFVIKGERPLEVKLSHHEWARREWSDLEIDKALEARLGAPLVKLSLPKRRRLTTLEELFVKDEVRQQVYEALAYLRDSYSSFKALFELMALPREEARRALIKMYRHGLIAQRDVGGVKAVVLTDLGRMVLEEYEACMEGGEGEARVE